MDLVVLLENETLFHIEFQSENDREMPYRQGIYCFLLGQKYRRRVRQAVVYIGLAKMRMDDGVDLGETKSKYTLIDIRELNAAKLNRQRTARRPGLGDPRRWWNGSGSGDRTTGGKIERC